MVPEGIAVEVCGTEALIGPMQVPHELLGCSLQRVGVVEKLKRGLKHIGHQSPDLCTLAFKLGRSFPGANHGGDQVVELCIRFGFLVKILDV
eukprot:15485294-Alexandrium_andersonii.AAC.1